jgi:hypothetical protein
LHVNAVRRLQQVKIAASLDDPNTAEAQELKAALVKAAQARVVTLRHARASARRRQLDPEAVLRPEAAEMQNIGKTELAVDTGAGPSKRRLVAGATRERPRRACENCHDSCCH